MASVLPRHFRKLKFTKLLLRSKKYSTHVVANPEIRVASEVVNKLSTLFVPGRHGGDMYQIAKPVIDIDYIINNLENLKLSCDAREINLDFDYFLEVAKEWLKIKNNYLGVVEEDQKCLAEIHRLNSLGLARDLKAAIERREKSLETVISGKKKLHDIEDVFMPLMQKIPHVLHPNAPLKHSLIDLYQEPKTLNVEPKSHTEIAKHLSLLDFTAYPSITFFMSGKLSELDVAIQSYFMDKIDKFGFTALTGVDFCKSFIIEAIGRDPHSSIDCIHINRKREAGQKLHLVGGASFETFCAYLTNMNIEKSTLPFKYFSLGRCYNAANKTSNQQNLFSVVQSTNVHGLIVSESQASNSFEMLLQLIIECYSELNIPYRVVNIVVKNLTVAESRRKQLELWSPALKDYIPVAYVSQHDDFVSTRLNITYGFLHEKEGYCHIVEGSIVNIPILIGCIVENFQTENNFNIPTILEKYILTD